MVFPHSSGFSSSMGAQTPLIPALAKTMSIRPQRSQIRRTAASMSSASEMSATTAIASPPSFSIRATVSCNSSSERPSAAIFAPSRAIKKAEAWPIPDPAPVTIATRSSSCMILPPLIQSPNAPGNHRRRRGPRQFQATGARPLDGHPMEGEMAAVEEDGPKRGSAPSVLPRLKIP